MLTVEECRQLLERPQMTDEEITAFLQELQHFLAQFLAEEFPVASPLEEE